MENVEKKVIRNYDEMGYVCGDYEPKYLIKEENIEEFKTRMKNESVSDVVEDMELDYVTEDFIMKDRDGDVFFLACNNSLHTTYNFDYVYSEVDEEIYTDEEFYESFTDYPVYVNYYDNNYSIEENPIEFEYDDYEVLVPVRGTNSGATTYFTKDEMVIALSSVYANDNNRAITLDTFLNDQHYDYLKIEALESEAAQ